MSAILVVVILTSSALGVIKAVDVVATGREAQQTADTVASRINSNLLLHTEYVSTLDLGQYANGYGARGLIIFIHEDRVVVYLRGSSYSAGLVDVLHLHQPGDTFLGISGETDWMSNNNSAIRVEGVVTMEGRLVQRNHVYTLENYLYAV